ncbi:MAG TPA: sulfite exporter TauE/SafE family protein [Cyclobacteriaceae bacterium]|nr:sulfite exporter TauE/SafE family protein [Cyclobacteriaceae bacterium]
METVIILAISFFIIALVYSSVGFGGGSSYLALMAVVGVSQETMRPSALLCNIVVVIGGSYIFGKEGHLDIRKSWPFIVASVPFAYLGGILKLSDHVFFLLLGSTLVLASLALWLQPSTGTKTLPNNPPVNMVVSSVVGFLSGVVSIGGGIFLSPILHLTKWDTARKISAVASIFILANSIGGLAGQFSSGAKIEWRFIVPLLIAVLAGGQIGSRLGARKFNQLYIRRITAALILVAGVNILRDHL